MTVKRTGPEDLRRFQPALDQSPLKKTEEAAAARPVERALTSADVAPKLIEAAKLRDLDEVKRLVTAWVDAQDDFSTLTEGLLALSNFLRVFGSGEAKPELYPDLFKLAGPADRPFDQGTLDLKAPALDQMGRVLQAIGKGHLSGELDLHAGDQLALKSLLVASNLGLMTDALKVKMAGWNRLTEQLATGTVSFELGIRKMPADADTNFWVVGGVNRAIEWVKSLRVSPEAVSWMKEHPLFKNYPKAFFDYFSAPVDAQGVRIPGEKSAFEADLTRVKIEALPDGEIYVGGPLMRVSGPPAAVEFLESNLMRLVTSWTTVATAAAQMTIAADGKAVSYFGLRRAPGGGDDAEPISHAAALGGMTVSSDLMSGFLGQPITGTMEHSIVLMLKTIFRHDPPRAFTAAEKKDAGELLAAVWKAAQPGISEAELAQKLAGQLEDVLLEAHIFKEYAYKYDREKSVALVDTSHPNIGVAAAMFAQKQLWAEGKDQNLSAVRLDSGCLLAQGLLFRQVLDQAGMGHLRILATDGLLPETVRFFEQVEDQLQLSKDGKLPASFDALMEKMPESVADTPEERAEIRRAAQALVAAGGLKPGGALFAGYGAGEKIADSVSTVGRPGIVYKSAELSFEKRDGEQVTVLLGKLASPSKATGPGRELFAEMGTDGKIARWVVASRSEAEKAGGRFQRLMRTVFEDGQSKVSTSQNKAIEYAITRRALLSDAMKEGKPAELGMTRTYKDQWLSVVKESDPTRVQEFGAYFDKMWPTQGLSA